MVAFLELCGFLDIRGSEMWKKIAKAGVLIAIGVVGIVGLVMVERGVIHEGPSAQTVPDVVGMRLDKVAVMLYSADAGRYDRELRFVAYEDGKSPAECDPIKVQTDRMEDYVVMATYPQAGETYLPGRDPLYLAVEDSSRDV